ncbi:MAG: tetratricopeptide repeat protein [Acidobacteria bacterium]|nr:tetratricopeptide repeat protein [Acidobacteriota bacterium]
MSSEKRRAQRLRERRERIRLEKHERRSQPQVFPASEDDDDVPPEAALGPRFAAERGLHDLHKLIGDRKFESIDEANRFIESAMQGGRLKGVEDLPKEDKEIARDLAYEAMEAGDRDDVERLARLALSHDPECVDALRMLALATARSTPDLIAMLRTAIQAGERALGPEFFEENRGHFWGVLEARPYMRARMDLTEALLKTGETAEAVRDLEALLELNEGDNQGVRYVLLPLYLEAGNLDAARKLLAAYPDDYSAVFHWCKTLERRLSGDLAGAAQALAEAREMNPYVEAYLTGGKLPPRRIPGHYSAREPSEAACFAKALRNCWLVHREAVAWLREQKKQAE